ncbi:MAG: hypothetical protein RL662_1417, partial [Bacteroidota bacterium]
ILDSIRTPNVLRSTSTTQLNWTQYGITFNAPSASVVLVMISAAPSGTGNDIVIDDIAFTSCVPAVLSSEITNVCEGGNATVLDSISGNQDYKFSQWQILRKGETVWSNLNAINTYTGTSTNYSVKLDLTNVTFSDDSTQYRLVLGTSAGNLSTPTSICNVISPITLLRVIKYPVLIVTDPPLSCNNVVDITKSSITTGSTLANSTLSYYSSLANATSGSAALSVAQAKSIAVSGTYFIKAITNTTPQCSVVQPVVISVENSKKIIVSAPIRVCKDMPTFDVSITKTNINTIGWKTNNSVSLTSTTGNLFTVTPTPSDLLLDSIWVKVSSVDNILVCPNVSDSVKVEFYEAGKLSLPNDTIFCGGSVGLQLPVRAHVANSPTSVIWAALGTSVSPVAGSSTTLNLSNLNTQVRLIGTVTKTGCNPRMDTMFVNFVTRPNIQITSLPVLCNNADSLVLASSGSNFSKLKWSGGNGVFLNDTTSNTIYKLSSTEKSSAAPIIFTISAVGSSLCPVANNSVQLKMVKFASVSTSPILPVCSSSGSVVLQSTSVDDSLLTWTGGTGVYANKNANNTTYTPTAAEFATGKVQFTITAQSKSPCPSVSDTSSVHLFLQPVVDALPVLRVCNTQDSVILNSMVSNVSSLRWFGGDGRIKTPLDTSSSVYYLSSAERSFGGTTKIYLEAPSNGVCPGVKDSTLVPVVRISKIIVGSIPPICSTTDSTVLVAEIQDAITTTWTGGSGLLKYATTDSPVYYPTATEYSTGTVKFTVTTTSYAPCPSVTEEDFLTLAVKPSISVAPLLPICNTVDSIQVSAIASNISGSLWKGGSGRFKDSTSLSTYYYPSILDKTSPIPFPLGVLVSGIYPCPQDSSYTSLQISPQSQVLLDSVGPLCTTVDSISLTGHISDATSLQWSSGGSGTFDRVDSSQTMYRFSATDRQSSGVRFVLESQSLSPCPSNSDTVDVQIAQGPLLVLNSLPNICENQQDIALSGSISNVDSVLWISKTGQFANIRSVNTLYTFDASDISDSSISFIAQGFGSSLCPVSIDTVLLKVKRIPSVVLDSIPVQCSNFDSVALHMSNSHTLSTVWTIGSGSVHVLSAADVSYVPTATEKGQSSITAQVIALGDGLCPQDTAIGLIHIVSLPTVSLSPVAAVCESTPQLIIDAQATNAAKIRWSSRSSGVFDTSDSLHVTYTMTPADVQDDSVYIRIESQGIVPCPRVSDSLVVSLIPLPALTGNSLQQFCIDQDSIRVISNSQNTTGITWSGSGGVFTDPHQDSTYYHLSAAELASGTTKLVVTAHAMAPCQDITDTIVGSFVEPPSVGMDTILPQCADVNQISLVGHAQNYSSVVWRAGSGTLSSKTSLTSDYIISAGDKANKKVSIRLIAQANAPCKDVSVSRILVINPLPVSENKTYHYCNEDNGTLTLDAGLASSYQWLGMGDSTRLKTVNDYNSYSVKVTNEYGCEAIRYYETLPECPPRLFISNAFSPNGDGSNDEYTVYGAHIGKFEMLIFNRWGEVIFKSNHMKDVWDGNYREDLMPVGVYEWTITYEGDTDKYRGPYSKKGSVTLVR